MSVKIKRISDSHYGGSLQEKKPTDPVLTLDQAADDLTDHDSEDPIEGQNALSI